MSDQRYRQAKDVFLEVCDLPILKRAAALEQLCADNHELRREVESLLEHFDSTVETAEVGGALKRSEPGERDGDDDHDHRIGPYRIVHELGRGGMGVVYLAMRETEAVRHRVALKVLKRGMDTENVLRRFDTERQMLAAMNHPNIARLYDTGETADGRPYFVMEYVDGVRIDEYCDNNRLRIDERLGLFRKICNAVAHAHKNLIVHRDLKPANILVTADGEPKLLDFGIAKLVNPELSIISGDPTLPEFRVMTPDYASPEQVRGEALTTSSDIYTLGVVLYELLSGHRPYRIHSRVRAEIQRIICEEDPEKPSTAVTHDAQVVTGIDESGTAITKTLTPEFISRTREGRPERLRRRLAGDIDNMVLMAMRKEPHRRYSSVEQFSEDIERHLNGLPVRARRSSIGYRASKFVRRNRSSVAIGVLAALLVFAVPVFGWQLERQQNRIQAAERAEAAQVEKVRHVASTLLLQDIHDRIVRLGGATESRQVLVDAALGLLKDIEATGERSPTFLLELAGAYEAAGQLLGGKRGPNIGLVAEAKQSFAKAYEIRAQLADQFPNDEAIRLALSRSFENLGDIAEKTGDRQRMMEHYQNARRIAEQLHQTDPRRPAYIEWLARTLMNVGDAHKSAGDDEQAEQLYAQSLRHRRTLVSRFPENDEYQRLLTTGIMRIAGLYEHQERYDRALSEYERAREIRKRLAQANPADVRYQRDYANVTYLIASLLGKLDRTDQAIEYCDAAAATLTTLDQMDLSDVRSQADLARVLLVQSRLVRDRQPQRALQLATDALRIRESLHEVDPGNATLRYDLSRAYETAGDRHRALDNQHAAEQAYTQSLSHSSRLYRLDSSSAEHARALLQQSWKLGRLRNAMGQYDAARDKLEATVQLAQPILADQTRTRLHGYVAMVEWVLAETCHQLGDAACAVEAARNAMQHADQEAAELHHIIGENLITLGDARNAQLSLQRARELLRSEYDSTNDQRARDEIQTRIEMIRATESHLNELDS